MEIVVTTGRWTNDPSSREVVDHLRLREAELHLTDAVLYYDFPAYADYETALIRPDILLLSPRHGFIAIRFVDDSLFQRSAEDAEDIDNGLGDFASNLHSRLLRSRELRTSRTETIVDIQPVILWLAGAELADQDQFESRLCGSLEGLEDYIRELEHEPLSPDQIAEVRSIVEGAKALSKAQKRVIENAATQPLAVAMQTLESEITNFDQKQRHIALVDIGGPARIRGLAGSGKTIILAMKAAHLHLNYPEANILFTFYTRSLRATIKQLITRFYRHYSETDPNWKKLHIRHGWGGSTTPGAYSDAARRSNRPSRTLPQAAKIAKSGQTPFGAACDELTQSGVEPYYDYVLIDEGQDFPGEFYRLCYQLAKGERDKKASFGPMTSFKTSLMLKFVNRTSFSGEGSTAKRLSILIDPLFMSHRAEPMTLF